MQEIVNGNKTMYIKFPTVTKLQYPFQNNQEHKSLRTTSYRQTLMRQTHLKIDIINKAQSFKIIHLPEKNQIMNICRMTVRQKSKQKDIIETSEEKMPRKKIFSVTKFNSLKMRAEQLQGQKFIRPLNVKKSISTNKIKLSLPPPIQIDYLQTYPFVSKLIALTFGIFAYNQGPSKIRRAKLDLGNNGLLIKQTLKKRLWWTVTTNEQLKQNQNESNLSLIWSQYLSNRKNLQKIQLNNSQYFKVIEQANISFPRNVDKILNQLPKIRQLLFTEWQQQKKCKDLLHELYKKQLIKIQVDNLLLINHLDNNWQITNKKLLYKNMVEYYNKIGINPNDKMPKTLHLTCFNWQDVIQKFRGDTCQWILKPGEFTNRGNGISVFRNTKQAIDYILNHPPKNQQRSFLLQQYITPMLYQQRKFDIRCYMLGVEIGKSLKFYWYEQGYIRTASQKFSLKKMGKGIHLTNDAIQKNLKHYGEHQSANKLSFNDIDKYCLNNTTFNFYSQILPEIKRITRDICHSVGDNRLIGSGRGFNFEIFGLDYLVDERGKPWLIEVNTNPSLQICCSLLSRIIPQMVQNAVRLVCDVFLPPKKAPQYSSNFLMNNKFALIYSNTLTSQ